MEQIPIWVKASYSALVLVIIPIYWRHWGVANFLWFSDISLITLAAALWLESSMLTSMMAVGVLLPEVAWNIDFFGRLLTGKKLFGLSDYMFDSTRPLFLRALSLFHVFLPPLIIVMLMVYGYAENAIIYQTLLAWIVLPVCYLFTDPSENINWVFGPGSKPQKTLQPLHYFLLVCIIFPVALYLPTHLILQALF